MPPRRHANPCEWIARARGFWYEFPSQPWEAAKPGGTNQPPGGGDCSRTVVVLVVVLVGDPVMPGSVGLVGSEKNSNIDSVLAGHAESERSDTCCLCPTNKSR